MSSHEKTPSRPFQPTPFTDEETAQIQQKLNRVLGPEYVSFRPGGSGQSVSYIEGWKALNLANEIFGFNGWSSELITTQVDYLDTSSSGRISMGLSVVVRITIKDGTYHEDFGYGYIENAKNKAMAFEKCKKEAFTDGLKRCLRCFGNVLGNCLYDKHIIQKIQKVKLPPPQLENSDFHRDPLIAKREAAKNGTLSVAIPANEKTPQNQNQNQNQTAQPHAQPQAAPQTAQNHRPNPPTTPAAAIGNVPKPPHIPATVSKPPTIPKPPIDLADFDDSYVFSDDLPENLDELDKDIDADMNDGLDEHELDELRLKSKQMTGYDEVALDSSTQVPEQVSFVNAKLADLLRQAPNQVSSLPSYNAKFVSPNIRRTVDPNKSAPVKRTDVPLQKRMIGMPPSQRSKRSHTYV